MSTLCYNFPLRDRGRHIAQLILPSDLSVAEAERLRAFISAVAVPPTRPTYRPTGWPPGLLQDDDRKLSRWFAGRLDARRVVRRVCEEIRTKAAAPGGANENAQGHMKTNPPAAGRGEGDSHG